MNNQFRGQLNTLAGALAQSLDRPELSITSIIDRMKPLALRDDVCRVMAGRPNLVATSMLDEDGGSPHISLGRTPETTIDVTFISGDCAQYADQDELERVASMLVGYAHSETVESAKALLSELDLPNKIWHLFDDPGERGTRCFILSGNLGVREMRDAASVVDAIIDGTDPTLIAPLLREAEYEITIDVDSVAKIIAAKGLAPLSIFTDAEGGPFDVTPAAVEMIEAAIQRECASSRLASRTSPKLRI